MRKEVTEKDFFNTITKGVFWDCNLAEFSLKENKNFLIGRVLMRGLDKDIEYIHSLFTLDEIIEATENCKECDDKCRNYYRVLKEWNYDLGYEDTETEIMENNIETENNNEREVIKEIRSLRNDMNKHFDRMNGNFDSFFNKMNTGFDKLQKSLDNLLIMIIVFFAVAILLEII